MNKEELFNLYLGKAMALCSRKEYCLEEMHTKLETWHVDYEATSRILQKLTREKFIDERRYAAAFARDKFNYNKWGRIKISLALRQKHIGNDLISEAVGTIDPDCYLNQLKKIIADQRRRIKARNEYELKAKLLRFALSKGYESSLVYDILGEISEY